MIKIERCKCPDALKDSPSQGNKYRCEKVVRSLWKMQHEKCCYCEQIIPSEGHSKAVEHFKPKNIFKYLKNDWKNLLLACPQCNGKKSDKFPVKLTDESNETKVVYLKTESHAEPLIINPSNPEIDPETHIDFNVDMKDVEQYGIIKEKDNSLLGRKTIDVIGLDRVYYTRHRRELFRQLLAMYNTLLTALDQRNNVKIQSYKDDFEMMMSAKSKFAAFVRAFVRYQKMDRPPVGLNIPVGAET